MCHTLAKSKTHPLSFSLTSTLYSCLCFVLSFSRENQMTVPSTMSSQVERSFFSLSHLSFSLYLSPVCASVASHSLFGAERSPFCSREHIASITSATRALHSMGPLILIKEQQKALETVASTCPCSITHSHITVAASHRIALHHALHLQ